MGLEKWKAETTYLPVHRVRLLAAGSARTRPRDVLPRYQQLLERLKRALCNDQHTEQRRRSSKVKS
jgi:hypothetical protein